MGQAIPTQHPAVVLKSHYQQLRILLTIAMIAVIGLTIAVVTLAGSRTSATPAATSRSDAAASTLRVPAPRGHGAQLPDLRTAPLAPDRRYDGGPNEGTRGITTATNTRYDGGPDEGTRGPNR